MSVSGETQNWPEVEEHLRAAEKFYNERGITDNYVVTHIIRPLRDRFDNQERTRSLAEEIMSIKF